MTCPRCATEAPDDAKDCASCGVIFAKWRAPRAAPSETAAGTAVAAAVGIPAWARSDPKPPPPEFLGITHIGWQAAAVGFVMACALTWFPFVKFILHPLSTLVHEIGHTVAFWLFGYSAVPAFDFGEGGGVTMTDYDRSSLIVGAWVLGLVVLAWWQRENKAVLAIIGGVAVLYFLMYNTRGEHLAISLGGHGGEILFSMLFIYRALTGWGVKVELERPLYAFIGFMILFSTAGLGFMLLGNSVDKAWYLQGKRGIDNDLVMGSIYLGWKLEGVARAMIVMCLLAVPAAFWAASMRKTIGALSDAEEAASI
jgi:hypothetical protein